MPSKILAWSSVNLGPIFQATCCDLPTRYSSHHCTCPHPSEGEATWSNKRKLFQKQGCFEGRYKEETWKEDERGVSQEVVTQCTKWSVCIVIVEELTPDYLFIGGWSCTHAPFLISCDGVTNEFETVWGGWLIKWVHQEGREGEVVHTAFTLRKRVVSVNRQKSNTMISRMRPASLLDKIIMSSRQRSVMWEVCANTKKNGLASFRRGYVHLSDPALTLRKPHTAF